MVGGEVACPPQDNGLGDIVRLEMKVAGDPGGGRA